MLKGLAARYQDITESRQTAGKDGENNGQDLKSILDASQRSSLEKLIVQLTTDMRDVIAQDIQEQASRPAKPRNVESRATSGVHGPETNPSTRKTDSSDLHQVDDSFDGDRDAETLALVTDALHYFDKWRRQVRRRVTEALCDTPKPSTLSQDAPVQSSNRFSEFSEVQDPETRKLRVVYPPAQTDLSALPKPERLLILHSILLLLLGLEHYSAHSRVLVVRLVSSLGLSLEDLTKDEAKVARGLLDAAVNLSSNDRAQEQASQTDSTRKWKVGMASVAGAALIGITGGLAAPLVAAGLGTVMGGLGLGATAAAGYLGALAGSSVIVGGLFGAYGGRMTGRMMDKYAREVEDFAFIPMHGPRQTSDDEIEEAQQDHRLRVTIGVTGWATDASDVAAPWQVLAADSDVFALRWELKSLLKLGNAIRALVTSAAWGVVSKQIISRTVLGQLASAVSFPLTLLKIARVLDNPFSVAKARADKTGIVLADALINKAQGERPVTLIGYSLGSRVIFACLRQLAKRRAFGLIESVILIGSPVPGSVEDWQMMRSVVSGRLVNVYSEQDEVLALLYRSTSLQLHVAGLQPVEGLPAVENYDVSDMFKGHWRYQYLLGQILDIVGLVSLDARAVAEEERVLADEVREEERELRENEQKGTMSKGGEPDGDLEIEEMLRVGEWDHEHHHHTVEMLDNDTADEPEALATAP